MQLSFHNSTTMIFSSIYYFLHFSFKIVTTHHFKMFTIGATNFDICTNPRDSQRSPFPSRFNGAGMRLFHFYKMTNFIHFLLSKNHHCPGRKTLASIILSNGKTIRSKNARIFNPGPPLFILISSDGYN